MVFLYGALLFLIGSSCLYFLIHKKYRKKFYYLLIIFSGCLLFVSFTLYRGIGNDTYNIENQIEVDAISLKESGPSITINSPKNESYSNSPPILNINCNDSDCHTLWYGNGIKNITLANNTNQDLDKDIWDTLPEGKYQIFIYANNTSGELIDTCTLILYKDTQAPRIVINSPNNQTYWNSCPGINITAFDPNLEKIYYKNGPFTVYLTNNTEMILPYPIWDTFSEGKFTLEIFAEDSFGHINDTYNLILFKDTISPLVTINYPYSNCLTGTKAPRFNISISSNNLDKIWYNLNACHEDNFIDEFIGIINQDAWDNCGNGTVTISFCANDTAGNIGLNNITIRKDAITPNIIINSPIDYQEFGIKAPRFNLTIIEDKLDTRWYTLDSGLTNITFSNNIGQIDQQIWEEIWKSHANGELITIRFYVNDSAGNIGYQDIIVKIKKTESFQLPNATLFIIAVAIGFALGISTFGLKKSKKYKRLDQHQKKKLNSILYLSILLTGLLILISLI
ncbi:MAG: hypothetical protein ACFFAN_13130 [Promethearchaeota archaeon]